MTLIAKKLLTAVMVVRSIFLPLCSDFLSVFEGEPHIFLAVDSHEIEQTAPKGGLKLLYQFGFPQGFKERFNRCSAGLLTADGLIQGFIPSLGGIESCSQPSLKPIEKAKISCARKLFNEISAENVKYHEVVDYKHLFALVNSL